jgi:hypothetical protein
MRIPEDLTELERRHLAAQARYAANAVVDPRYPREAGDEAQARRWREIADLFHPDPWGSGEQEGEAVGQ